MWKKNGTRLLLLIHTLMLHTYFMQGSLLETALRSCSIPSQLGATLFDSVQKYGATLYQSSVCEALINFDSFLTIIDGGFLHMQHILESSIFLLMLVSKECTISWDQSNKISSQYQTSSAFTGKQHNIMNNLLNSTIHSVSLTSSSGLATTYKNKYDYSIFRVNPITWAGQEVLLLPVDQEDESSGATAMADIFHELYSDDEAVDMDEEGTFL